METGSIVSLGAIANASATRRSSRRRSPRSRSPSLLARSSPRRAPRGVPRTPTPSRVPRGSRWRRSRCERSEAPLARRPPRARRRPPRPRIPSPPRQSPCHLAAIATPSTRCSRSSGASADTTIANRSRTCSRTSPSSGLNVAKTRGAHACDAETPSRSTLFAGGDDGEDEIGHRVVHQVEFVEVQHASVRAREESRGEDGRGATHGRLDVDASGDGVFGRG